MIHTNYVVENKLLEDSHTWHFQLAFKRDGISYRQAGAFEDEYVKVDGEWKIKTMLVHYFYFTPFDEGWVKTKMFGQ